MEYIKVEQELREIFRIYFKSVFLKIKMSDYLFLNKLFYVEIFYIWNYFYMKSLLSSSYVMKCQVQCYFDILFTDSHKHRGTRYYCARQILDNGHNKALTIVKKKKNWLHNDQWGIRGASYACEGEKDKSDH